MSRKIWLASHAVGMRLEPSEKRDLCSHEVCVSYYSTKGATDEGSDQVVRKVVVPSHQVVNDTR